MSLQGSGSTSNYVSISAPDLDMEQKILGGPRNCEMTLFCWYLLKATGTNQRLVGVFNSTSSGGTRFSIQTATNGRPTVWTGGTGGASLTITGNAISTDTWIPVMATVYYTGTGTPTANCVLFQPGSSSTGTNTPTAGEKFKIFAAGITIQSAMAAATSDALIAEAALWHGTLTQADYDRLQAGVSPADVRPGQLIRHHPLLGDLRGRGNPNPGYMTPTGAVPTFATHPAVSLPRVRRTLKAGGLSPIVGTLDKTLGSITLSGVGELAIAGALNATLGGVTLSAAGELAIAGELNATLGGVTLAATGQTPVESSFALASDEETALHRRFRRRGRTVLWHDPPQELLPAVALAEHYGDAVEVQQAVDDAMARFSRIKTKTTIERRMRIVEELNREIIAAVSRAADDEDDELLGLML